MKSATDVDTEPEQDSEPLDSTPELQFQPRKMVHPRKVLCGVLLMIALSTTGYVLYGYLGPTRIVEGPLVQQTTPTSAIVVWYTSRPTECAVLIDGADAERWLPATGTGCRQRVAIERLPAGGQCAYAIVEGERKIGGGTLHLAKSADMPFSFIVFGDSGRGSNEQYALAALMPACKPDFLLHTGDLVYPAGERDDYAERFFRPYAALLADVSFWPSPGNHDVAEESKGGTPYREVFELPENGPAGLTPEASYWFDYAAARIVVFDSNLDDATTAERIAPWMRQALSAPQPDGRAPRWKFVVMHHPAHSIGKYGDTPRVCTSLVPIFEELGVDVVFSGHDHLYERTKPMRGKQAAPAGERGVVYIVTGAGGAKLYEERAPDRRPDYYAAFNNSMHSFTVIEIDGSRLRGRQIGLDSRAMDEWSIAK